MEQLYAQLFGVGLLWVTFHCSGMCGPIMAGMVAHNYPPGSEERGHQLGRRAAGVLAYQGGRAITYAILGALAGGLGAVIEQGARAVTQTATLVAAALMIALALFKLIGGRHQTGADRGWAKLGRWLGRQMRRIEHIAPRRGAQRMGLFGLIMGLLPCMLMFWALSLAIASSSPWHGAALMVGLVALTTPMLLAAGCSTALLGRRFRALGERLVPGALLVSGAWMGLIAAAANGWIAHVHIPFRLGAELYTVMLW